MPPSDKGADRVRRCAGPQIFSYICFSPETNEPFLLPGADTLRFSRRRAHTVCIIIRTGGSRRRSPALFVREAKTRGSHYPSEKQKHLIKIYHRRNVRGPRASHRPPPTDNAASKNANGNFPRLGEGGGVGFFLFFFYRSVKNAQLKSRHLTSAPFCWIRGERTA